MRGTQFIRLSHADPGEGSSTVSKMRPYLPGGPTPFVLCTLPSLQNVTLVFSSSEYVHEMLEVPVSQEQLFQPFLEKFERDMVKNGATWNLHVQYTEMDFMD
jgi:hypothetical protein